MYGCGEEVKRFLTIMGKHVLDGMNQLVNPIGKRDDWI